jgi:hypothetical protein
MKQKVCVAIALRHTLGSCMPHVNSADSDTYFPFQTMRVAKPLWRMVVVFQFCDCTFPYKNVIFSIDNEQYGDQTHEQDDKLVTHT